MNSDIIKMIKKVSVYDMIIGIFIIIPMCIVFASFVTPLLIGLVVAIVNFAISSTVTDLLINKKEGKYMPLYFVSFIVRITVISLIGFAIFTQNKYNVLAYVGGYSINLIGVSLYAMIKK